MECIQIGSVSGEVFFEGNVINWTVPEGNDPDGAFNLVAFKNAQVYFVDNEVTGGCIGAGESAHAVAYGMKLAKQMGTGSVLINLSGRGDKDMDYILEQYGIR